MKLVVRNLVCIKDSSHKGLRQVPVCKICGKEVTLNYDGFYSCGGQNGDKSHLPIITNDSIKLLICDECGSPLVESFTTEVRSGNPKSISYQKWLKDKNDGH